MEHVENLLKTTLAEIERLLTTRTVVGEPITVDGSTVIPLVAVGFGFGAGGGSGKDGKAAPGEAFGGGSGGGGGIKPVALVIASKDGVRVESVRRGVGNMAEKVGEAFAKYAERRAETNS
jgi:uncharacterized spore protein YtfJ